MLGRKVNVYLIPCEEKVFEKLWSREIVKKKLKYLPLFEILSWHIFAFVVC